MFHMKTTALLIALLAMLVSSQAQDTPPPAQPPPARRVVTTLPPLPATIAPLDSNYTVKVQGGMGSSKSLDVTLSGNGPRFMTTLAEPRGNIMLEIGEKDGAFFVTYNIFVQFPVQENNNISYRDTNVIGSFLAKLDEPFPILKVGDQSLTIELEKTKGKKE